MITGQVLWRWQKDSVDFDFPTNGSDEELMSFLGNMAARHESIRGTHSEGISMLGRLAVSEMSESPQKKRSQVSQVSKQP